VFDGAVTSVSPGDQVEVVCQSWAAELNAEIGMEGKDGLHIKRRTEDLVLDALSKVSRALGFVWWTDVGYADIVRRIFDEVGDMNHFGRAAFFADPVEFQPARAMDQIMSQGLDFITDATQLGATDLNKRNAKRFLNFFNNPKDDNIWINWDRSIPWYAFQDKETAGKFSFDWYIYRQTGWDALQELLLWFPGNIAVELPFNERNLKLQRATMYVGPRDGLYLAEDVDPITNKLMYDMDRKWVREKAKQLVFEELGGSTSMPPIDPPSKHNIGDVPNQGDLRIVPKGEFGYDERFRLSPGLNDSTFTTGGSMGGNTTGDIHREVFSEDSIRYPDRRPIKGATNRDITPHGGFDASRPKTTGIHRSVDYAAPIGTEVVATHAGAARVGTAVNMGRMVGVTSSDGRVDTQYGHLNEQRVKDGEWVEPGRVIGTVGDTGNAKGTLNPHVHYILKVDGERRNPEKLLSLGEMQTRTFGAGEITNRGPAGFEFNESKTEAITRAIGVSPTNIRRNIPMHDQVKSVEDAIMASEDEGINLLTYFEQMLNGAYRHWRPRNPQDLWGRPAFKKVTRTHFLDSYHHIIENKIRASSESMWNKVTLHYPSIGSVPFRDKRLTVKRVMEEESEAGMRQLLLSGAPIISGQVTESRRGGLRNAFDLFRGIFGGEIVEQPINTFDLSLDAEMDTAYVRNLHTFQKNIDPEPLEGFKSTVLAGNPMALPIYYRIANAILANGIREMYTGTLTIMMDPSIRPWDRVYLFDYANEMSGSMGVEEVHHHIDFETGATTTIVPDMIVEHQNFPAVLADSWYLHAFNVGLAGVLTTMGTSIGLGAYVGGLPGGIIGAGVGTLISSKVGNLLWFKTAGRLLGREPALKFTGLYYRNKPYVAGMEGARRETTYAMVQNAIFSLASLTDNFGYTDIYGFIKGDRTDLPVQR
jgi:hypothetical protein